MKYLLYLVWILYILAAIIFVRLFVLKDKDVDVISSIKNKIVIIIPEEKLESINSNPGWIFNEETWYWIWAWFFISSDWEIQTVNHIVENDNIKYTALYNNKEYNLEVLKRDKENDLAILKIQNSDDIFDYFDTTKKIENINENDEVYSFWVNIDELKIVSNSWTILNTKSKLDNKSNLLEVSNTLSPGFSGWPIINTKWIVVWINYAISNWKSYWISF